MEERTLCKRCAENYRQAGYLLEVKEFQQIRTPCDICSRKGVEYTLMGKTGGDKH